LNSHPFNIAIARLQAVRSRTQLFLLASTRLHR